MSLLYLLVTLPPFSIISFLAVLSHLVTPIINSDSYRVPYPPDLPNSKYFLEKRDGIFVVDYFADGHTGSIIIGNSNVPLYKFVGNQVIILARYPRNVQEATYQYARDQQCIQNQCVPIFRSNLWSNVESRSITIDIEQIELAP